MAMRCWSMGMQVRLLCDRKKRSVRWGVNRTGRADGSVFTSGDNPSLSRRGA